MHLMQSSLMAFTLKLSLTGRGGMAAGLTRPPDFCFAFIPVFIAITSNRCRHQYNTILKSSSISNKGC